MLQKAKLRLRLSSNDFDNEISELINFAKSDLLRIGVKQKFIDNLDSILQEAILIYVKANFGNSDQFERLNKSYDIILTKIKGDTKYFE